MASVWGVEGVLNYVLYCIYIWSGMDNCIHFYIICTERLGLKWFFMIEFEIRWWRGEIIMFIYCIYILMICMF